MNNTVHRIKIRNKYTDEAQQQYIYHTNGNLISFCPVGYMECGFGKWFRYAESIRKCTLLDALKNKSMALKGLAHADLA